MTVSRDPEPLKPKDYASDQEVRWCPGCGDYAIVNAVRTALADLRAPRDKTVFVSGIGCAARFPYYMSTYGFHTIHGRAPAIATGLKLSNPELDVWIVSGDGDALSIGGNHLLHLLRRNVDVQFLLFNNEIYGLTKGQYSPTSREGTSSPSSPAGSVDHPVHPCVFALGAGGTFVARGVDGQQRILPNVLKRAKRHRGAAFVEIFQNCIVYNDGVFAEFTEKDVQADRQLHLVHGEPMIFGKDKGIRLNVKTLTLEVATLGVDGVAEDDLLAHDETNLVLAQMLAAMKPPCFPMALGVLYAVPQTSFDADVAGRVPRTGGGGIADLNALLREGHTWKVE